MTTEQEFFETWRQAWRDDLAAAGTSPEQILLARASEALANRDESIA